MGEELLVHNSTVYVCMHYEKQIIERFELCSQLYLIITVHCITIIVLLLSSIRY